MKKTELINSFILIARRVPPGDRWRLVSEEPDGVVHTTLTDALESYMRKSGFKGDYKLAPLKNELYAIATEEIEIKPDPIKTYSIYGEYGE
jgi:hypothetical protein